MRNLIDSVSDHAFALEFLSAGALCAMHLSIFSRRDYSGSSAQFQFIHLSDAFLTGSPVMPQKRNLDAAEAYTRQIGTVEWRVYWIFNSDERPTSCLFKGYAGR